MRRLGILLVLVLGLYGCGSAGSTPGASATGGSGGSSSATGGTSSGGTSSAGGSAGSNTAAGGSAGNAAAGGSAGNTAAGGSAGSGATGSWTATPDWTTLPLPLDSGPSLAPHPTDPKTFAILATNATMSGESLVVATTHDLGKTFPESALLSSLGQTSMATPQGIAFDPKNPEHIAAALYVEGPQSDPSSGSHLYVSNNGGSSFTDSPLPASLPLNSLASTELHYTSTGSIALRGSSSILYTTDGSSVIDTLDVSECASGPGGAPFAVDPEDDRTVALPCGNAVAVCTHSGCNKTPVGYTVEDVAYGTDAQHLAAIGRSGDKYFALVSKDGGKSFNANQSFSDNVTPSYRIAWDPRPGQNTVYALLVSHLFRSSDAGKSWQDITPPQAMNYVYDFVMAADGTLIARGVFHYLLFTP